jgi:aspartyl-tRNA synthetase
MKRAPRANRYRTMWAGDVRKEHVGGELRVSGWVHRRRDHGGLIFIDLRDRSGVVQLVFHPEHEAHAKAKELRAEDVISAFGPVVAREEQNVNADMATGEIEIDVREFDLLADSETPPFPVDEDSPVGEDTRLRYRYIDLRREHMLRNMELRHEVVQAIRAYMNAHDFLEIETPILTKSTPEGARDYLVPSRVQRGAWYALPQSPQLFKQILMISGYERYYQIARCFRDEDLRADRQPEFTQLDVEMAFVEEDDVIDMVDGLLKDVFAVAGVEVSTPIERLTYDEVMLRYGSDRPDRRIGMEISDLSEVFAGSGFQVFASAEAIRGFKASGHGDVLFLVADTPQVVARVLGGLRSELGAGKGEGYDLLWVTDFPMFEWDEVERRVTAMHHPFTAPTGDLDADPLTWRSRAYDIVMNGTEIGGGSIRINTPEVQRRVFDAIGLPADEAQARFGFLLDALDYGAPPHGGIAFGLDRIVALLAGKESIREVIAFPKTATASDLMTGAPSEVEARQLKDLGIRLA